MSAGSNPQSPPPPAGAGRGVVVGAADTSVPHQLAALLRNPGFAKLFTVRIVSQCGDGMFQVGLATLFFFSPQNMASAGSVAAAFAVLLLPFTIVGPFAGPLLDRWSRRQTLLVGNAVRVALTGVLAALLLTVGVGPLVYVLALVTLGVNRFLLSALSAGVPLVVPRDQLSVANSLTPTLGAVSAVVGGVLGFVVSRLVPAGPPQDALSLVMAALFFAGASALALRLRREELGPTRAERDAAPWDSPGAAVRGVVHDLATGVRYLWARRTPGLALVVLTGQRFAYGLNFLALLLISRNLLSDPSDPSAGLATFAAFTGISLLGNGLAILVTPFAHRRMAASAWLGLCTVLVAVSQFVLLIGPFPPVVAVSAVVLGLGMQGSKISVDTIVHRDTHDALRGRAFAIYDVLFNGGFVAAAALGAAVLPDEGYSKLTFLVLAVGVLALAGWYARETDDIDDTPLDVDSPAGR